MASCYLCGKQNVNFRRNVRTGKAYRNSYTSRGSVSSSTINSYGLRTVCANCALEIDYEDKKRAGNKYGSLAGLIVGISIFALFFSVLWGSIGIGLGLLVCFVPQIIAKSDAKQWYDENKGSYIDDIDLKKQQTEFIAMIQKQEEEKKQQSQLQEEKKKEAEEKIILQSITGNLTDRLMQEKELLLTKVEIFNKKYADILVQDSNDIKRIIKDLEDDEADCEKTDKKIKKLCDDYIKQIKSIVSNKELLDKCIKFIEQFKAAFIGNINTFISNIKNTETQILKFSLQFSEENKVCRYNNEAVTIDFEIIDDDFLLPYSEIKVENSNNKFNYEEHLEKISSFSKASEIIDYLESLNIQDSNFIDNILPQIKKYKETERIYGNMKNSVMQKLKELTV